MSRRFLARALGLLSVAALAGHADAQDSSNRKLKAYGSRVGDRDQGAEGVRTNGGRRINNRLETRIDSRLNTRLERFSDVATDEKSAYTPQVDDGTKRAKR